MKSVFLAVIIAAVIVMLMARVWFGVIDFLNEITRQPSRQFRRQRQRND